MTRRKFVPALAAGSALMAEGQEKVRAVFETRTYHLRNTPENQRGKLVEFLSHSDATCFSSMIAEETPFVMAISSYASLAAMEQQQAKLAANAAYQKALGGLVYERMDVALGRAFPSFPEMVAPSGRVFELRRYESNNAATLAAKIKMFGSGEIAIFQRLGMRPVFFAETIAGPRMPNLTYMLSYDDLASREKMWKAFGADPEWQKLRATPGWSDAEIVSNISVSLLSPLK